MDNNLVKNDAAECLEMAHRCLIEASRTLDREAAETMRILAKRYFKKATVRGTRERGRARGAMVRNQNLNQSVGKSWKRLAIIASKPRTASNWRGS